MDASCCLKSSKMFMVPEQTSFISEIEIFKLEKIFKVTGKVNCCPLVF